MRILYAVFLILSAVLAQPFRAGAAEFHLEAVEHTFDIISPSNPFSLPTDVVVGKNQRIYVLDGTHNKVKVFDYNGKFLSQFGREGSNGSAFDTPVGIGIDGSDNIYVCDSQNARIAVFDSKGQFLRDFNIQKKEEMVKPDPVDIAIDDAKGYAYITDNANHRIVVYTVTGKYIGEWGSRGEGDGSFRYPATLAFSPDKRMLYVVDVLNTRVQVFNSDTGKFIRQIGSWGLLPGEMFRPKGVAVDKKGRVYVTDSYMDVIQVFDDQADFQYVLGDGSKKIRRFTSPASVFIDSNNRLYVVEVLENKVGVYKIK